MGKLVAFPETKRPRPEERLDQDMLWSLPSDEVFATLNELQLVSVKKTIELIFPNGKTAFSEEEKSKMAQVAAYLLRRSSERLLMPTFLSEAVERLKSIPA